MARKRVIELTAATTLSKNQSGALCILNAAAGFTVTLPTGAKGLNYEFVVRAETTGNPYCISSGSNSMEGFITLVSASGGAGLVNNAPVVFYSVDLTARVASMGGCTNGGLPGTNVKIVCDEDGVWHFSGVGICQDTVATPFGAA